MNYIIEYYLPDGTTRKKVVEDCEGVAEAIEKFSEQHEDVPTEKIVGVIPTSIAL